MEGTSSCHMIGDGAVIGAGSIVTRDVPPFAIVAGNPGKVLRYRFNEDICKLLIDSHWWDLTPDELMKYYDVMEDPAVFAQKIILSS